MSNLITNVFNIHHSAEETIEFVLKCFEDSELRRMNITVMGHEFSLREVLYSLYADKFVIMSKHSILPRIAYLCLNIKTSLTRNSPMSNEEVMRFVDTFNDYFVDNPNAPWADKGPEILSPKKLS